MPTYEFLPGFTTDLDRLTPEQRRTFRHVVTRAFVPDLRAGRFRASLRIKHVRCAPGVYRRPRLSVRVPAPMRHRGFLEASSKP
ncbi:hypothetical protein [Streptomyces roseifaciens]|uniref:hypothetical protein n=1 Tax=Streptomyces roseifaciens TaxID=1488406 RepID=UPI0007181E8B|nr:hypothetical protein [Streptomyces roseifaciens]